MESCGKGLDGLRRIIDIGRVGGIRLDGALDAKAGQGICVLGGLSMFTLDVRSNLKGVLRKLQGFEKEVATATAKALTFTAEAVQAAEVQKMKEVFDRPTPFTLNSLRKSSASPNNLEAAVWFKDNLTSAQHYLQVQIDGGERPQRRSEKRLAPWMNGYRYMMPGAGAPLDGYGNMRGSLYTQIFSQLGALNKGDNQTAHSKAKHGRKNTAQYFVAPANGKLKAGIYQRVGARGVKPIMIFTSKAQYRPRFPFYTLAQQVAEQVFPEKFDKAIEREMNKAFNRHTPLD